MRSLPKLAFLSVLLSVPPVLAVSACSGSAGPAIPWSDEAGRNLSNEAGAFASDHDPRESDAAGADSGIVEVVAGDGGVDAGQSAIQISEVYVDTAAVAAGSEYVELRGAAGTPLRDLRIRVLSANGSVRFEVDVTSNPLARIGATGFYVVGGTKVDALGVTYFVDRELGVGAFGLNNEGGSIQLISMQGGERSLIDVVGYTAQPNGAPPLPPVNLPPSTTVLGQPAVLPSAPKRAIGRRASGARRGDNRSDFCSMSPTPGFPQAPCQ